MVKMKKKAIETSPVVIALYLSLELQLFMPNLGVIDFDRKIFHLLLMAYLRVTAQMMISHKHLWESTIWPSYTKAIHKISFRPTSNSYLALFWYLKSISIAKTKKFYQKGIFRWFLFCFFLHFQNKTSRKEQWIQIIA